MFYAACFRANHADSNLPDGWLASRQNYTSCCILAIAKKGLRHFAYPSPNFKWGQKIRNLTSIFYPSRLWSAHLVSKWSNIYQKFETIIDHSPKYWLENFAHLVFPSRIFTMYKKCEICHLRGARSDVEREQHIGYLKQTYGAPI